MLEWRYEVAVTTRPATPRRSSPLTADSRDEMPAGFQLAPHLHRAGRLLGEPRAQRRSVSESKTVKTLFSARELAERWSLSPSSIYHRGESLQGLTPVYIGRSVRFHLEDVEKVERDLIARARRHKKR